MDPQTSPGPSLPPSQANPLLSSFTTFLTVAIHSLLFHRNLYPPSSFLTARAYNLPVHQSRHPAVCAWVRDAVSAVSAQLRAAAIKHVVFVVHGLPGDGLPVLERWVFDAHSFPAWGSNADNKNADAGGGNEAWEEETEQQERGVNWTDVNEALRGALRRIAYAAEGLAPLPDGCTFTLAIELRDEAEAPISHPQSWIPSQTDIRPPSDFIQTQHQTSISQSSTVPIRSVRADPLFFECWLEKNDNAPPESTGKSQTANSHNTTTPLLS